MQFLDSPANVHEHGNDLFSVKPRPDSYFADRSFLAIEPEPVRFFVSEQFIVHIIKGGGSEYGCRRILNLLASHPGPSRDLYLVLQVSAFLVTDTGNLNAGDHDFHVPYVIGTPGLQALVVFPDYGLEGIQLM